MFFYSVSSLFFFLKGLLIPQGVISPSVVPFHRATGVGHFWKFNAVLPSSLLISCEQIISRKCRFSLKKLRKKRVSCLKIHSQALACN